MTYALTISRTNIILNGHGQTLSPLSPFLSFDYPATPHSISFCERYTSVLPFHHRIPVSYRSVALYYYPSSHLPPPPPLIPQGQFSLLPFLESSWLRDPPSPTKLLISAILSCLPTCVYSVFINFSFLPPLGLAVPNFRPLASTSLSCIWGSIMEG